MVTKEQLKKIEGYKKDFLKTMKSLQTAYLKEVKAVSKSVDKRKVEAVKASLGITKKTK